MALTILFHAERGRAGERAVLGSAGSFELSRLSPEFSRGGPARPLADAFISRSPVRIHVEGAGIRFEQPARVTPLVVDGQAVERDRWFDQSDAEAGIVVELAERTILLLHWVEGPRESGPVIGGMNPPAGAALNASPGPEDLGLIGVSDAIEGVRRDIRSYAPLRAPALLRGSTGSGKELVARALHDAGPRAGAPFIAVNVSALSQGVAASELFGHKKGAFTGADADRLGYFQQAEGGTLFLDEIGEASLDLQALLLRALETSTIQPVGGGREIPVDVRVVAATDADLAAKVAEGSFRPALLHRLQGSELWLPSLGERREDLGLLLEHLVDLEAAALGVAIPPAAPDDPWIPFDVAARLVRHRWPGNVRELRNVARQLAVLLSQGDVRLERLRLAPEVTTPKTPVLARAERASRAKEPPRKPGEVSDEELLSALERADWRLERAAAALGISRTSLYRRIESHPQLRKSKDLSAAEINAALAAADGDVDRAARALKISKAGLRLRLKDLGGQDE